MMNDRTFEHFLTLHRGLPRQAPGGRDHTLHALSLVPDLPLRPRIVDLGCGPGAQTLDLIHAVEGSTVVAVDLHEVFLGELRERAHAAGVSDRVRIVQGDMAALPEAVHPASFHLVWSEGAAYIMGFDAALRAWRHLLLPGGFIAVSELAWLVPVDDAPAEARTFFSKEYPDMREDGANRAAFEACGYELSGSFTLAASAWWEPYYTPMLERLPGFEAQYAEDEAARAVAAATREEIDTYRRCSDSYGYVFYVGRMR